MLGAPSGPFGRSLTAAEPASRPVTFAKDVAPILQEKCQDCHQPGSIAPMSLLTYEETRPWAQIDQGPRDARARCRRGTSTRRSAFRSSRTTCRSRDEQIDTIVRWVDAGAPLGDPKDMPPPKQWADNEWDAVRDGLGKPDLVIKSDPYTMAAHHQDVWWRPMTDIA